MSAPGAAGVLANRRREAILGGLFKKMRELWTNWEPVDTRPTTYYFGDRVRISKDAAPPNAHHIGKEGFIAAMGAAKGAGSGRAKAGTGALAAGSPAGALAGLTVELDDGQFADVRWQELELIQRAPQE